MVEAQVRPGSAGFVKTRIETANTAADRTERFLRQVPAAMPLADRLRVQTDSSKTTARVRRQKRRAFQWTGDAILSGMAVIGMVMLCAMGVIYFAAFAEVTAKGNEIRNLQVALNTAQARGETLVQQRAQLGSAARITKLASEIGMVQAGDQCKYVTTSVPQMQPTQVAMAR